MRELFVIDKKNYIENGTVFRRPSVRGIISDGYKIEKGETFEQALIREVGEESTHQFFLSMLERENRVLEIQ